MEKSAKRYSSRDSRLLTVVDRIGAMFSASAAMIATSASWRMPWELLGKSVGTDVRQVEYFVSKHIALVKM
jgi:hypothetical protein